MAHFSLDIAHDFASPGAHVAADSEEVAPYESAPAPSRSQAWLFRACSKAVGAMHAALVHQPPLLTKRDSAITVSKRAHRHASIHAGDIRKSSGQSSTCAQ
jgi:hypothetical protein